MYTTIKRNSKTFLCLILSLFLLVGCSSGNKDKENHVDVSPEAKMGDTVVIDFEGYLDGKKFEGGSATQYYVKLGSNTFIDNFEEQISGHKVGDNFDVNVTFPENYKKEDLKSKDVVFKVTLHEVWRKIASDLE